MELEREILYISNSETCASYDDLVYVRYPIQQFIDMRDVSCINLIDDDVRRVCRENDWLIPSSMEIDRDVPYDQRVSVNIYAWFDRARGGFGRREITYRAGGEEVTIRPPDCPTFDVRVRSQGAIQRGSDVEVSQTRS